VHFVGRRNTENVSCSVTAEPAIPQVIAMSGHGSRSFPSKRPSVHTMCDYSDQCSGYVGDREVDEFQIAQILAKLTKQDAETLRNAMQLTKDIAAEEVSLEAAQMRASEVEEDDRERLLLQNQVWSTQAELQELQKPLVPVQTSTEAFWEGFDSCVAGIIMFFVSGCLCLGEVAAAIRKDTYRNSNCACARDYFLFSYCRAR